LTPSWLVRGAASEIHVRAGSGVADVGARSYVADGRSVVWAPACASNMRFAVDAEIADQPVPPTLARRSGIDDPAVLWPLWTAVELSCKLTGTPLALWLRQRGLQPEAAIAIRTFVVADLVVSCGAVFRNRL
jgi:hypothetical protein